MSRGLVQDSKFMSLVLRHAPEKAGLVPDSNGWVEISALVFGSKGRLSDERVREIVATSDKQRFAISADGTRIRANQGHSIKIDLGLRVASPPDTLYHGTATRFLGSIWREGLKPGKRHHVHLSADVITAHAVGKRHGTAAVLKLEANKMVASGFEFFLSENGVWLTSHVPPEYLQHLTDQERA